MGKIKTLALIHGGMTSHTVRVTAIAKALRSTGLYDITFSGDGSHMKIVEDAGFKWIKTELVSREELFSRIDQNLATIYYTAENYEKYFEIEKTLLEKFRPDIILREHFREMAGVAAKRTEARIFDVFVQKATLSPYYHFDFRPEKLPQWIGLFPERFLLFAARLIENHYRRKNSHYIRRKLKELGLKKFIAIDGVKPDLTLFPDAQELFELPDADRRFCKHIGPVIVTGQDPVPGWLEEYKIDKRKKILITKGTTGEYDQTNLFENTFNNAKYAIAFYSVADRKINDFYGCNKFNIDTVLPFCDLLISHSGTGSNYLAIKHKVPMLVFYDHFEQQINAVELERKGVALRLGKNRLDRENILTAVEELLNNSKYKQNISILSEKIGRYDSLRSAVKYISEGFENFKKNSPDNYRGC
ncbi:MAG: nucleotide disphospho-sugar-binding domain-containing protein [Sedimentisphaerales bacterium]